MSPEYELIAYIFSENFQFKGRVFRPEQRVLALAMIIHYGVRWDHTRNAPCAIGEAAPGIGKSLVELVVALVVLYCSSGRCRTVISTYSVALRSQLLDEAETAIAMLDQACQELGLPAPQPAKIAEYFSLSQYISPYRMTQYDAYVANYLAVLSPADIDHWYAIKQFYEIASQMDDGVSLKPVKISDLLEVSESEGLPFNLGNLSLAITDNPQDKPLRELLIEQQRTAQGADVVIVTHMMGLHLLARLHFQDALEQAGRTITHDTGEYELFIGDEAHKLPPVARNQVEDRLSLEMTREVMSDIAAYLPDAAKESFEILETWLRDAVITTREVHINQGKLLKPFLEVVRPFHALTRELLVDEQVYHDEPVLVARLELVLLFYTNIIDLYDQGGASSQALNSMLDVYPIIIRRGSDVIVRISAGETGSRTALLWRRSKLPKRLFKSVILISGTVADGKIKSDDPYNTYRRMVGARYLSGDRQDVRNLCPPIPAANMGHAVRLILTDRDKKILPSLDAPDARGSYTNPSHTEFVRDTIATQVVKFSQPQNRVMTLFKAEDTMIATYEAIRKLAPAVAEHIILQRKGMPFNHTPLKRFRDDPHGILFTLNWEGINAVDTHGRSLTDHLVMSKLPLSPADERTLHDSPYGAAFRWEFMEAHWSLRQALARAMRDQTAKFTCWILDPRLPLPSEMDPAVYGYPRYVQTVNNRILSLYSQFEEAISQRLFGKAGLMGATVEIGILGREGKGLYLDLHEVTLSPRYEDLMLSRGVLSV